MQEYTTISGDMWDAISHKFYGTEKYTNVLIDANPDYVKTAVFGSGVVLSIPEIEIPDVSVTAPWRRKQS